MWYLKWKTKQKAQTYIERKRSGSWLLEAKDWGGGESEEGGERYTLPVLRQKSTNSSNHKKNFFCFLFFLLYLYEQMGISQTYCNHFTICLN